MTGLLLRDQNRTTSLPALRLPLSLTKPAKNSTKQPNESIKSIKRFPNHSPPHLAETALDTNHEDMWNVVLPIYGALRKTRALDLESANTVERLQECHQLQPITFLRVAIIDVILKTSPQC